MDTSTLWVTLERMPLSPLSLLVVLMTDTVGGLPEPLLGEISMPRSLKPLMLQFSMRSDLPETNLIPLSPPCPVPLIPLIDRFRMTTLSAAPALTTMPLVPETNTEATWPPPPSRVMALVIVRPPKPPGSSTSISPPAAVLEIAPANVLQGAVRLHG